MCEAERIEVCEDRARGARREPFLSRVRSVLRDFFFVARSARFPRAARHSAVFPGSAQNISLREPKRPGGTTRARRTTRGGARSGAMADATVASSPPRVLASTGDAVASPSRSAEDAGTRDEGDVVGTRRERVPVPVSEMATRLRVSEATVEALEEALAAKARALAEAATREAKLRTDLDAARLGLVTPSAGRDVPGDDDAPAPATEDPSAHPALRRWRDRARAAESARDDAERRAARLARENAALVSMLERYRGTHPDPTAHPDPTNPNPNPPASIRDEMRVAVAEGELASCRARLREAETALDDWRAHAANLSDRLAVAEASAAAADAAGPTRADVEALARRVEEAERLAATAVAAAANPNPNANANKTPVASPSSVARRRRADANDARLEQSRRYLERADAAATVVPAPAESESASGSGSRASALVASASARAASGANAALAEALAAARRVSETAERRAAAGAEALRRAAALEKSASRRLALGPAAAAVVDVRRAVESIERAVAEAE